MKTSAEVVICGAGIAGISTAYMLAVKLGVRDVMLVSDYPPMSLTSDKSTECYRNWWPGPGDAMVRLMNRSIDLMEEVAQENNNVFHLNRRGYLYTTADPQRVANLEAFSQEASSLGAGEIRYHTSHTSPYQPAEMEGFSSAPSGADLITNRSLIQEHFPYLSDQIAAVLHVRRAGWLSAQQFGTYLLQQAKACGVKYVQTRITGIDLAAGRISGVQLANGDQISASIFVNAAGPLAAEVGEMMGVELPFSNELHQKASFNDKKGAVARNAPLLIFSDEQRLEWSQEEKEWLEQEQNSRWLTGTLPTGAHLRPEGGAGAASVLLLWDLHDEKVPPRLPPTLDPMYPELALRGMCRMVPALKVYLERMPPPFTDGGYYTKTQENRPLACPLPLQGAFLIGALSGFGIMSAAGLSELLAAHITSSELPVYAPAFSLGRYHDPAYQDMLDNWGSSWEL